jgi:Spy/CpxP family protein refolding chaperone
MMRTVRLFFLLTITLSLGLSVSAQVNDPAPSNQPTQQVYRQLGLSQEQLVRIREINRRQRPRFQRAELAVRSARVALDEAIYSPDPSEERVREALVAYNRAQAELTNIRLRTEFEIRKILTPEQLTRFRSIRENRMGPGRGLGSRPRGRRER